ncbi:MAG: DMT family transporter [Candidatus Bathyarchaeota archaeon]|nr:DMT family transporter [Candidatus Bathyarchaeota archaeon]
MLGELAALGAALSWALSAVLYKKALRDTKPFQANMVRLACTGVILLVFLALTGNFVVMFSLPQYAIAFACISGIVGLGIGDTLYMLSLKDIGVGRAVSITCTYPLFSLLWARLLMMKLITFRLP